MSNQSYSVTKARTFARVKHRNQTRKDGKTPFYNHLKKVVKNIKDFGVTDSEILCAGWLHDVIENTDTNYDKINQKFGKKTADWVAAVSKDKRLAKSKQEKQYILQLKKAPWQAKVVKLGDILANLEDLQNSGYEFVKQQDKVKKKMLPYTIAIKSGIAQNKKKIPNLHKAQTKLNSLLEKYNQKSILF